MPAPANDTSADRTMTVHPAGSAVDPKPPQTSDEPSVCPFCGELDTLGAQPNGRCGACGAYTDPLSRQATQNEMGPWFIRDEAHPFRPGCRLETIERWVRVGRVLPDTVLRGPTTHQNWERAARVPGVAHLLGVCHACQGGVSPEEVICHSCGAGLMVERDRQHLGLSPVRAIPGRADPGEIARALLDPNRASVMGSAPTANNAVGGERPEQTAGAKTGVEHLVRPTTRAGRLDRRITQANRRAGVASLMAVLFAALFALSMFMSWGGERIGRRSESVPALPDAPARTGDEPAD